MAKFKVKEKPNEKFKVETDEKNSTLKELIKNNLPPFKAKTLPSGGLFYPDGVEIYYKPYTWSEIKLLNSGEFSTINLWKFILEGIVTTNNFNKEDLTLSDFFYISFLRKKASVGNGSFSVPVICTNLVGTEICKHKNKFIINEKKDITFEEMEIKKEQLPLSLFFDDEKLEITALTLKKSLELMEQNKNEDDIALLSSLVTNKPFEEVYSLFKSLNPIDGEALEEIDRLLYHGLSPIIKECEKCNQELKINLDAGGTIIKPFRTSENNGRLRICFSDKGESTDS